jgi:6-pyruvoyltetrahydropterin/6-carboxytetrahydropterin synthase
MATELANPQTDRASLIPEGRVFAITKSVNFEAAHYMGGKPEGHPYRNVHGHSFLLEATVSGTVRQGEQWTLERICLWAAADLAPALPGLTRIAVARPSLNERCELIL